MFWAGVLCFVVSVVLRGLYFERPLRYLFYACLVAWGVSYFIERGVRRGLPKT